MKLSKLFDLKGKTAFVPGGYGGIGAAISRGLAQAGAKVVIAGRDGKKARTLAGRIGRGVSGVALDVEDVRAIRDAVASIPRIDILVNCVGIQIEQALTDVTEEAYDHVYRTNLKAAMFLAQAVAKKQIAAKSGGRQVHLLSVRAQLGLRGRGYSAYCSTKGGLVMLIRQHASELGKHGICVNGVAPTVVRTEMGAHWLKDPKTAAWLKERIPLGRVAEPEDCVGATLFFCSPAGSYVTGQILYLDGGITASQ
jgi:gluconate 5-dehydrogenase